jgi:hypothetical protein
MRWSAWLDRGGSGGVPEGKRHMSGSTMRMNSNGGTSRAGAAAERNSFSDVLAWLGAVAAEEGNLRGEPRVSVRAPVRLVAPIDPTEQAVELFEAETRDVTPGGMCLVAPWRPTPGQTCRVELPAAASPNDGTGVQNYVATLRCRVCYSVPEGKGTYRTGLTFMAAA